MTLSIFLAKTLGLYCLLSTLALLINRRYFEELIREAGQNRVPIFFSGFFSLIIGLLITVSHNFWQANWIGLITLLGWLSLAKGGLRLFFPRVTLRLIAKMNQRYLITVSIIFLIIGLYLTYVGFFF